MKVTYGKIFYEYMLKLIKFYTRNLFTHTLNYTGNISFQSFKNLYFFFYNLKNLLKYNYYNKKLTVYSDLSAIFHIKK